ncbi:hypothetical protein DFH07DRAFT_173933 [Mycena maculata]|uniref:Transmembrane protein n=1 Tax=Mycena maculata TaxID=230809 RepID=A0AAD7HXC1_9AGAR|nr:hypothetical protein DFH07DRAFT_173933 [Mycena maculata]
MSTSKIVNATLSLLMCPVYASKHTFSVLVQSFRVHPVAATFKASIVFLLGCLLAIFLSSSDGVANDPAFQSIGDTDGIFFLGHAYQTDLDARTVTFSWLIGGCGKYMIVGSETYHPTEYCGAPNIPVNVYIDSSSTASFTYGPTLLPRQGDGSILFVQSLNQFSTTHIVSIRGAVGFWAHNQDFYYPFDTYDIATVFVAINPVNASTALPILRLTVVDAVGSFLPATEETAATGTLNASAVAARVATIHLARTELAKAFTLVLFVVNWALAIAVLYLIVVAAVLPATDVSEGVLLVPLTVILTIPALRALFVDAPEFGIMLDILGIFMQMALVSLCSIGATLHVVPKPRA